MVTIGNAAAVLPPIHFSGVSRQAAAGNVMVRPDFRTAQAGEKAFRHVRAAFGGL
jgi:hypothetical protein